MTCQVFVDDPIFVFDTRDPRHIGRLSRILLWTAVTGFPLKLEKSDAGSKVKWIGATIEAREEDKTAIVSIPEDKVTEYTERIKQILSKPVVGKKQLRSLAGALSFVAGVVPLMHPFLGGLWATLCTANDGPKRTGNLVHTKRIAHSLNWILALLGEKKAPFVRVFRAIRTNSGAIVVVHVGPWWCAVRSWGTQGIFLLPDPVRVHSKDQGHTRSSQVHGPVGISAPAIGRQALANQVPYWVCGQGQSRQRGCSLLACKGQSVIH